MRSASARRPLVRLARCGIVLGVGFGVALALAARRNELPPSAEGVTLGIRAAEVAGGEPTIVVLFRGSWCEYCRHELSRLAAVVRVRPQGIRIFGVSSDSPEALADLKQTLKLPFELRAEDDQHLSELCRFAMHCVLLFDAKSRLRWAGYAETWHAPVAYDAVIRAAYRLR